MTDAARSQSGSNGVIEALAHLQVRVIFGLPGVHNLSLWRELVDSDIRLVCVRHEQSAVYAADGYARATGELGVALVTSGPGAANTLAAAGEAMASGSPVLIIATDISSQLRHPGVYRGVLHETRDQTAMFVPVTKDARLLESPEDIAPSIASAGGEACSAPSGPVYVGIPNDFLTAKGRRSLLSAPVAPRWPELDEECLREVSGLLSSARFPLIWAGGGALRSGAGALLGEMASKLAAPAITTYGSRGLLAPEHPCFVPGPVHVREVGELWDEADVVLAVGTDFDAMMTQNWRMPAPARLISINTDTVEANKNYRSDFTLVGDARWVLAQINARIEVRPGLEKIRKRLADIGCSVEGWIASDEPQAAAFLDAIDQVVAPETAVVADMCIPGYWLAGFRRFAHPRTLAYPVGWGTLGFGFPASIGACVASSRPTICVCGDAGFLFACGELATVAELRIPLTVVLVDDGGYGMLRYDQEHAGQCPVGVDLRSPDFVGLANSFGISASRVTGFRGEFTHELAQAISSGRPAVLVVQAALKPPPNTSPRWYRSAAPKSDGEGSDA